MSTLKEVIVKLRNESDDLMRRYQRMLAELQDNDNIAYDDKEDIEFIRVYDQLQCTARILEMLEEIK